MMSRREFGITTPPEITKAESQLNPTETSLPSGVPEKTHRFLIEGIKIGAHENLSPRKRNLIGIYFGTEATLSNLKVIAGLGTRQGVNRLIRSGMEELWQNLPSHLQEEYPLEEVIKLKTLKGRRRSPEARRRRKMARKRNKDEEESRWEGERELWEYARGKNLLPDIVATGMVSKEEITALRGFFEGKGARKPSEGLLNRFSIALVRLG